MRLIFLALAAVGLTAESPPPISVQIQRFDEALNLLARAVRLNPDEPLSWLNLGVSLEAKGDRKGAATAYRQAVLLQPDFARAKEYLSRVSKD